MASGANSCNNRSVTYKIITFSFGGQAHASRQIASLIARNAGSAARLPPRAPKLQRSLAFPIVKSASPGEGGDGEKVTRGTLQASGPLPE